MSKSKNDEDVIQRYSVQAKQNYLPRLQDDTSNFSTLLTQIVFILK